MPHNKDQHFNPQFYLRNFSADENGKSTNLYNIALAKCIFGASIAGNVPVPTSTVRTAEPRQDFGMLEDASAPMFRR